MRNNIKIFNNKIRSIKICIIIFFLEIKDTVNDIFKIKIT